MSNELVLIEQCQQLFTEGKGNEEIILFLRRRGCSKVQTIALIAKALNLGLTQAKEMVHTSNTWKDAREQDERFHDSLEKGLKK